MCHHRSDCIVIESISRTDHGGHRWISHRFRYASSLGFIRITAGESSRHGKRQRDQGYKPNRDSDSVLTENEANEGAGIVEISFKQANHLRLKRNEHHSSSLPPEFAREPS